MPLSGANQTGSLVNHLMGIGGTPNPEVGATRMGWTDRSAYWVNSYDPKTRIAELERAHAIRIDRNGMSDAQTYHFARFEEAVPIYLKFFRGSWRFVNKLTGKPEGKANFNFNGMSEYHDYSF
jgi:hypothetical protein